MLETIKLSSVFLADVGEEKRKVVKVVQELLRLHFLSANELVSKAPCMLIEDIFEDEAQMFRDKIKEAGADVEVKKYEVEKKVIPLLNILTKAMAYEEDLEPDEMYQFVANETTSQEIIEEREIALEVKIPNDLKNIYLKEGNGIQYEDSWNEGENFQLYPVEKVISYYEFFKKQCSYFDISMNHKYSEKVLTKIETIGKELFVYGVDNADSNQFVDILLFHKDGGFYAIHYDHDEIYVYYEEYIKDFFKKQKPHQLFEFLINYIKNLAKSYDDRLGTEVELFKKQ